MESLVSFNYRPVAGKQAATPAGKTMTVKTPNNLVAKLAAKLKGRSFERAYISVQYFNKINIVYRNAPYLLYIIVSYGTFVASPTFESLAAAKPFTGTQRKSDFHR
jgi:hypothetical protein